MTESFKVHVNFHAGEWSSAQTLLARHGFGDLAGGARAPFGYHLPFADAAAATGFIASWRSMGFSGPEPVVSRQVKHTPQDVRRAELVLMVVRRAEKGFGGPQHGTQYDLGTACPRCGTGAVQVGPLIVKPSELAKGGDVSLTLDHEVLLSPGLAAALSTAGMPPDFLRPVRGRKGEEVAWVQLYPTHELPPVAAGSRGLLREKPCPVCGRDGFYADVNEPMELVYAREDVNPERLPLVTVTWERFGKSRMDGPPETQGFASPRLVVKPEVVEVFSELMVKGIEWVPVRLT
jgi:hypothetical protein